MINSRYAVVITRHRTQSGEPGASVADGVQDADTAPEPRPAEPATPSTAALRSAGGDDLGVVRNFTPTNCHPSDSPSATARRPQRRRFQHKTTIEKHPSETDDREVRVLAVVCAQQIGYEPGLIAPPVVSLPEDCKCVGVSLLRSLLWRGQRPRVRSSATASE